VAGRGVYAGSEQPFCYHVYEREHGTDPGSNYYQLFYGEDEINDVCLNEP
jgi:hypothetical protein